MQEVNETEYIWAYRRNGEVFITPDYDLANLRGAGEPTLIYENSHD